MYYYQNISPYEMMSWNLNPRTGQSMSPITDPFGNQIAANVFGMLPEELYAAGLSGYKCCIANSEALYNERMAMATSREAQMRADAYSCCWTNSGYRGGRNGGCNCG